MRVYAPDSMIGSEYSGYVSIFVFIEENEHSTLKLIAKQDTNVLPSVIKVLRA